MDTWYGQFHRLFNNDFIPRPFYLWFLIALHYAIWRGKAWEVWSCVMTSGRQRVDMRMF